jgi:hypothetical protein
MQTTTQGGERPLTPSSPACKTQQLLDGRPKLKDDPFWAATACAVFGSRLYTDVARWPAGRWGHNRWLAEGEPEDVYRGQRQLAGDLQEAIRAARTLLPALETPIIEKCRAVGRWAGVTFLGRSHTSAHAACSAFGEFIFQEFCWSADLDWHMAEPRNWMSDREDWDAVFPDPAQFDLDRLPWPYGLDNAHSHLKESWKELCVPDPAGVMAVARIEATLVGSLHDDGDPGVTAMRRAIQEVTNGRTEKPAKLIKQAGIAEKRGREALRKLEGLGEYEGFARCRPRRYR